ncbi:MAG: hypothetical protein ACTSWY_12160 [Promethearchaeota archaeon]
MSELPTYEGLLQALPATIMQILGVEPPANLESSIPQIIDKFAESKINRIIFIMLDNLGLFEITYYKPQFMIEKADGIVLLSTKNPYTLGVLHQLIFGALEDVRKETGPNGFHLLRELKKAGLETVMVGREKDLSRYKGETPGISKDSDMATWIEASKVINRHEFSFIHFLDFESLYRSKARLKQQTPEELIQKLIKRTDKWLLSLYKQARSKSLLIVLGNHGRYKIDLNYQGKVAEWRKASVPIAILIHKK